MCGRVVQTRPLDELAELYGAPPDEVAAAALRPRFNVAPTDPLAVVVADDGRRRLTAQRWGLLPRTRPAAAKSAPLINARAETIMRNGLFRSAFERRRCLVPVDGFYEWERLPDRRQPWFIHDRDGTPLTLAGIWAPWGEAIDGRAVGTCAIVTTAPDAIVGRLHDRMPVSLAPAAWDRWLDPQARPDGLLALLAPVADAGLSAYPVGRWVNSVRNDGPQLLEPVPKEHGEQGRLFADPPGGV
jgi:putative SOS response-associated peptidase YedK